jgi:hypothetical protein
MKEIKAVIDTNVLVSILKGNPYLSFIYFAFKQNRFKLVINSKTIRELSIVLRRPRLKINPADIKELFRVIKARAIRLKTSKPFITACRDPKDNFLIELAILSQADFIVTGDQDLLCLNPFQNVQTIPPAVFIAILKNPQP